MNKKVQEELKLTAGQVQDISDSVLNVRVKYLGDADKVRMLEPKEKAELLAKVEKETLKAVGDVLKNVLKPEQAKRLKQIEFQEQWRVVPQAFLKTDAAKELQLTDKQKKRIVSILDQLNQDLGASLLARELEEIPKLRKKAMDDIRSSLNDEQKKKLEDLTGKPFELPRPGPGIQWPGTQPGAPFLLSLPGSDIARLLLTGRVQKELKLTEEQTKSIRQAQDKVQKQFADQVEPVFKLVPGEKVDPKEAAELSKKVNLELRKAIGAVLEPGQLKRLGQIELQQQGLRAFENKEVALALQLTEEHKRRVKMLNGEFASKFQMTLPSPKTLGRDRAAMAKAVKKAKEEQEKLLREAGETIQSLLAPDQRKTWQELTGKPFQFPIGYDLIP
jgi:hypothetical protein